MLSAQTPVSQIVLDHSECATILVRHRIDYCCNGGLPLAEACKKRGVDPQELLGELEEAITQRSEPRGADPRTLKTDELVAHIVRRHHRYLRGALPFLVPLATKVARVHGAHNANLLDVRDLVEELADTLEPHLDHEEQVLFPVLVGENPEENLAATLAANHGDHLEVADLLEELRNASHNYHLPGTACSSFTTLYRELQALEADLFEHVHLENHVLLPRFARS
ncbi:MAG: iron-sulfur cluster repair di-iron protein [Myxococcota bacterium]|nr:iron-sulfur cluster repair di-iron protein [Myxococcota bacterium]